MHIQSLGYIEFMTHRVAISRDLDSDHILCFKSTDTRCDFDLFTTESEAVDYILTPFPSIVYNLKLPEAKPKDSA
jgi:hypothetical protein